MTGFPTETMEDVEKTLDYVTKRGIITNGVCEYVDFSYLSSFKLEQLTDKEKREHTKFLIREIKKNNRSILLNNIGKTTELIYSGKTDNKHFFYTPTQNIFAISSRKKFDSFKPGDVTTGTPKKLTFNRKQKNTVYEI